MHSGGLIGLFTKFAMLGAEWVMWVLVALSVATVALMFERAFYFRSLSDDLDKLAEDLRSLLRSGDLGAAKTRLEKSPSPAAAISLAGLADAEGGVHAAEEAMAGASARVRMNLERNLAFLGTVGNNAPFIGLFGTVIGIIQAFDKLRASEAAAREVARRAAQGGAAAAAAGGLDTGAVMGTLAEALVATAIGLLVAIPAVAAFNFFQRKVKGILASTETVTRVITAHLASIAHQGPYRTPATVTEVVESKSKKSDNEKKS